MPFDLAKADSESLPPIALASDFAQLLQCINEQINETDLPEIAPLPADKGGLTQATTLDSLANESGILAEDTSDGAKIALAEEAEARGLVDPATGEATQGARNLYRLYAQLRKAYDENMSLALQAKYGDSVKPHCPEPDDDDRDRILVGLLAFLADQGAISITSYNSSAVSRLASAADTMILLGNTIDAASIDIAGLLQNASPESVLLDQAIAATTGTLQSQLQGLKNNIQEGKDKESAVSQAEFQYYQAMKKQPGQSDSQYNTAVANAKKALNDARAAFAAYRQEHPLTLASAEELAEEILLAHGQPTTSETIEAKAFELTKAFFIPAITENGFITLKETTARLAAFDARLSAKDLRSTYDLTAKSISSDLTELGVLYKSIDDANNRIDALKAEKTALDGIQNPTDAEKTRKEAVEKEIQALEQKISNLQTKADSLADKFAGKVGYFDDADGETIIGEALENTFNELTDRIITGQETLTPDLIKEVEQKYSLAEDALYILLNPALSNDDIAVVGKKENIEQQHLAEALSYRKLRNFK